MLDFLGFSRTFFLFHFLLFCLILMSRVPILVGVSCYVLWLMWHRFSYWWWVIFEIESTLQARQSSFQRTLTILSRVKSFLGEGKLIPKGGNVIISSLLFIFLGVAFFFFNIIHLSISVLNFICGSFSTSKFFGIKGYNFVFLHPWLESLRVMIVCGSDLIQSFSIPGFWIPEQVLIWRAI